MLRVRNWRALGLREEHPSLSKDLKEKIAGCEEIISFLVFERKFLLALLKKDEKAADALIDKMSKDGSAEQKKVMPLIKLVKRFQLFRRMYPEFPARSKVAPEKSKVNPSPALRGS